MLRRRRHLRSGSGNDREPGNRDRPGRVNARGSDLGTHLGRNLRTDAVAGTACVHRYAHSAGERND